MLVPAAQGANSHIEYALSGVAHFVTGEGHEAERAEVRKGLAAGIAACTDKPNQAFLLSLLQICSTAEDAEVFVKYANDEYLADAAIRGLISTPASEGTILQLMQETEKPTALLAYAASKRRAKAPRIFSSPGSPTTRPTTRPRRRSTTLWLPAAAKRRSSSGRCGGCLGLRFCTERRHERLYSSDKPHGRAGRREGCACRSQIAGQQRPARTFAPPPWR